MSGTLKLLRTIRLDPSDTFIFAKAAEPGEWAVPGSFVFWDNDVDMLDGKSRASFRSGFLGLQSFGWSTLVQIVDADEGDRSAAVDRLAGLLLTHFGAPDEAAARAAAAEEIAFAVSLCDQPVNTLIALQRTSENGTIREAFRTLKPRESASPSRVFSFLSADDAEDDAQERVDLARLAIERIDDRS